MPVSRLGEPRDLPPRHRRYNGAAKIPETFAADGQALRRPQALGKHKRHSPGLPATRRRPVESESHGRSLMGGERYVDIVHAQSGRSRECLPRGTHRSSATKFGSLHAARRGHRARVAVEFPDFEVPGGGLSGLERPLRAPNRTPGHRPPDAPASGIDMRRLAAWPSRSDAPTTFLGRVPDLFGQRSMAGKLLQSQDVGPRSRPAASP